MVYQTINTQAQGKEHRGAWTLSPLHIQNSGGLNCDAKGRNMNTPWFTKRPISMYQTDLPSLSCILQLFSDTGE